MPDSFAGLLILDRWSGVFPGAELVSDMTDPDFGLPEYYEIRAGENQGLIAKVHHSRILRFTGRNLPYLEKIAEMYWGESEIEPVYEDIVLYDSVMANMGNLTFQANVDTLAIKNLEQLFAIGSVEQQKRFWAVMQAQSVCKSNFGTRLIDQDTQLSTQQYSFTGFNYVVEAVQTNLSAKTHIPVTKLFGRSPAGMNATGDSDMQNYYDFIDGLRESRLRPILERLVPIICMSTWGEVPEDMGIVFPPLWTPTAIEVSQIAGAKSQAIIAAFQSGLLNMGPAMAELKKLSDETGMFDTIDDEIIEKNKDKTFQDTQQMNDPLAELMGGSSGTEEEGSNEENPFTKDADYKPDFIQDPDTGMMKGSRPKEITPNHDLTYVEAKSKLKTEEGWYEVSDWTEENLELHFNGSGKEHDHKSEYPGWSINNYRDWSRILLKNIPDNKTLFGEEVGDYRFRYCPITGDFVKEHMKKRIITMFRPTNVKSYYDDAVAEAKEENGR